MTSNKKKTAIIKAATSTTLVVPDTHANYQHDNERADYLSKLIDEMRPDCIVMMGDLFDMPSLSSYDKGKACAVGRTYRADIEAGRDFDDRMWASWRKAKARYQPRRVALEGNHEFRLTRALRSAARVGGVVVFQRFRFGPLLHRCRAL